jgi:hypothetical protein
VDRDTPGKALQVKIGNLTARCVRCGAKDFLRARRRPMEIDSLICATCAADTSQTLLLQQITREIIRRGEQALKDADAVRNKPRGS